MPNVRKISDFLRDNPKLQEKHWQLYDNIANHEFAERKREYRQHPDIKSHLEPTEGEYTPMLDFFDPTAE